nr:hypothetical protein [Bacilli bacterium]
MKDIFRLLLFRMRKEALGYIVLGLIAVFNAVLALILGLIHLDNPEAAVYLGEFMDFSFSPFYVILGTVASFNPLILIIMGYVALFIGKEWRQRTFRNFLLAGKSRMSIYLSFYLFGILAALGLVIVGQIFYWPIGLAFGVSFRPANSEAILYLIKFAVNLIAYLTFVSMAIGIVFLVPNGWATIGISYGFFTVITLIPTLIQIIFALTNTPLNPNEPWNFIFLNN